jgi:hypothetical protein
MRDVSDGRNNGSGATDLCGGSTGAISEVGAVAGAALDGVSGAAGGARTAGEVNAVRGGRGVICSGIRRVAAAGGTLNGAEDRVTT